MIYTISKNSIFIPGDNGNKKLPAEEQGKVYINHPSALDMAEAVNSLPNIENQAGAAQILMYVRKLENIKINDDGKIRDAVPMDLITVPSLINLMLEIKEYIKKFAIDKKK